MAGYSARIRNKRAGRKARAARGSGEAPARERVDYTRAEQALRESEERFRATFEQAAVGVAHTTTEGRFLQVNSKLCQIVGYTAAELLGLTTRDLTHPDDRDRQDMLRQELLAGRRASFAAEKRYRRKDGTEIWVNRTVTLARSPTTGAPYLIQVIEDISQRKQTEARLGRLMRARRVMVECNQILVHAADETAMLESMCRVVVESGGYKMAWVGLATGDSTRPVYAAAHAGFEGDTPMTGSDGWGADGRYQGFLSEVMATGEPHIARNILNDPAHVRRRARALQRGFQSSIALPLKGDGRLLGALALYAVEPDAFDDEEIALLTEMTDDIAFGIVSLRERTARQAAEAAQRESEQRFRETFEQAAVGITRVDLNGVLVDFNQKFCDMLDYGRDELLGKHIRDITHPEDYGRGAQYRAQLTDRAMKSATGEKRFIRKDGTVLWARRTMSTACDAAGKPLYVISVVEDITERKELERRFELTFNQAAVGMTQTGLDGRLLQVNQKYADMVGYTLEELYHMRSDEITHPEDRAESLQMRQRLLNREIESASSEKRLVRKDGRVIWVNRTFSLVRDASGEPLHYIAVLEDITERVLSARRQTIEHAVTSVLAQAATVDEAMPKVLQTICRALGWTCGAYWKWDESAELLRCADSWHVDAEGVAQFIAASRETPNEAPAWHGAAPGTATGGVVRWVWSSGAPAWFADVTQHPDFRRGPMAAKAGLHSAFGFPVLAGTQPLGVMEFYSREINQPDEALLQMVRSIGSQIGQFIQRMRAEAALRESEEQLKQLAHYDVLTRLPNRALFYDRMKQALAQARRNQWTVGVMFIDLDRFKNVNDTLGHATGDRLLQQVSGRLAGAVRADDTVGRLGGDEFAIVLSNLSGAQDAGVVAQKIMAGFDAPFELGGSEIYVTASIGITLYPDDSTDQDTLIRNADAAMYQAKQAGRNAYRFYTSEMNATALEALNLENSLRRALERNEFLLEYQPKVALDTGAITGFEALLRWQQGASTVAPAEFIPILEETGLIVPVGEWVLKSVCRQLKQWERDGVALRPVAVNLSARQFQHKDLAARVGEVLRESGVEPGLIELELTETLLMSEAEEAVETLRQLKALGVRLAVDDFGTGYSSLAYLKRFPLDALKIDRGFIRDAVSDPDDAAIVCTIISLAHSLDLKIVAEGVETEGQYCFLKANSCDEMQGYHFAQPLPVEECTRALVEGLRLKNPPAGVVPDAPVLLLVDDDEDELLQLQRALSTEGFHILTANSARAAFEVLARHGVHIVISDHHMPEMSGIEFLTGVRKLYPNTVRVVTSGSDDAPTVTRATNKAGIHRVLSKSWGPERLRAEVREALGGGRSPVLKPAGTNRSAEREP